MMLLTMKDSCLFYVVAMLISLATGSPLGPVTESNDETKAIDRSGGISTHYYHQLYSPHLSSYLTYNQENGIKWENSMETSSYWCFEATFPTGNGPVTFTIQHWSTHIRNQSRENQGLRLVLDRETGKIIPQMAFMTQAARFTIKKFGSAIQLQYIEDYNDTSDHKFTDTVMMVFNEHLELYKGGSESDVLVDRRPEADFLTPKGPKLYKRVNS